MLLNKDSETPESFSMISSVGSPDKYTGMVEIATKNINQYDTLCHFLSIVRKAINSSIPLKIMPMTGMCVRAMWICAAFICLPYWFIGFSVFLMSKLAGEDFVVNPLKLSFKIVWDCLLPFLLS